MNKKELKFIKEALDAFEQSLEERSYATYMGQDFADYYMHKLVDFRKAKKKLNQYMWRNS